VFTRKNSPAPEADEPTKADGKGRATPTRKEAEAAAKQRAKNVIDPKARSKEQRLSQGARVREAMRTGDDRYLPARDQGPVKRFVRDWVDTRVSFLEFIIPLAGIMLLLGFSKQQSTRQLSAYLELFIILMLLAEGSWIAFRLRRAVQEKFPNDTTRGLTRYALMRSINMRFMRMPKTQVGWGGKPKKRS
jgi:hypothetical protein